MAGNDVGRRGWLAGMAGWGLIPAAEAQSLKQPERVPGEAIVVTLLGTGSPELRLNRFGGSTLVQAAGHNMLFDAGRGCTLRLGQLQIPLGQVGTVFLTHFHSDHVNGLPDFWLTGYIQAPYASRHGAMRLIGPVGTNRLADAMHTAFGDDIRIRMADEKTPEAATTIESSEFTTDGLVFDQDGVQVRAFEVDHGPLVKPAFGYRIDYAGRSVVISGDTRYNENVIRQASGVDLLVHEVCAVSEGLADNPMAQAILNHHTSPERAGEVFSQARPKLAAYTHVGQVSWPPLPADHGGRHRAAHARNLCRPVGDWRGSDAIRGERWGERAAVGCGKGWVSTILGVLNEVRTSGLQVSNITDNRFFQNSTSLKNSNFLSFFSKILSTSKSEKNKFNGHCRWPRHT